MAFTNIQTSCEVLHTIRVIFYMSSIIQCAFKVCVCVLLSVIIKSFQWHTAHHAFYASQWPWGRSPVIWQGTSQLLGSAWSQCLTNASHTNAHTLIPFSECVCTSLSWTPVHALILWTGCWGCSLVIHQIPFCYPQPIPLLWCQVLLDSTNANIHIYTWQTHVKATCYMQIN